MVQLVTNAILMLIYKVGINSVCWIYLIGGADIRPRRYYFQMVAAVSQITQQGVAVARQHTQTIRELRNVVLGLMGEMGLMGWNVNTAFLL